MSARLPHEVVLLCYAVLRCRQEPIDVTRKYPGLYQFRVFQVADEEVQEKAFPTATCAGDAYDANLSREL